MTKYLPERETVRLLNAEVVSVGGGTVSVAGHTGVPVHAVAPPVVGERVLVLEQGASLLALPRAAEAAAGGFSSGKLPGGSALAVFTIDPRPYVTQLHIGVQLMGGFSGNPGDIAAAWVPSNLTGFAALFPGEGSTSDPGKWTALVGGMTATVPAGAAAAATLVGHATAADGAYWIGNWQWFRRVAAAAAKDEEA